MRGLIVVPLLTRPRRLSKSAMIAHLTGDRQDDAWTYVDDTTGGMIVDNELCVDTTRCCDHPGPWTQTGAAANGTRPDKDSSTASRPLGREHRRRSTGTTRFVARRASQTFPPNRMVGTPRQSFAVP